MLSVCTEVRVTIAGSTSYVYGTAVLPRLLLWLLGMVILRDVTAGDVTDPAGRLTPVEARWMVIPKASVETIAAMEAEDAAA